MSVPDMLNHSAAFPSVSPAFILSVKVVVGVTCVLSVLGAALIIFTYVAFRDLRTTARQILVNVSLADMLVAGSHLVGLYTNYVRFLPSVNNNFTNRSTDALCTSQAAFLMWGTLASFFWTVALAVHLLLLVVFASKRWPRMMLVVYYPVCWCVPVALTVVLGGLGYLGFEKSADVGYCYARLIPADPGTTNSTYIMYSRSVVAQVMAYDLWLYMAFIAVPVLFITTHCYLRKKLRSNFQSDTSFSSSTPSSHAILRPAADFKLLFIPAVFLLLRIWSLILDIPVFYVSNQQKYDFRMQWVNAALVMLADIGDSAQGLSNAILYCILTKQVRQRLLHAVLSCSCHSRCRGNRPSSTSQHESTTQLIDSITTINTDSLGETGGGAHGGRRERRWWLGVGTLQENPFYGSLSLIKEDTATTSGRSRVTH